jgi:tRNA(Ile)-lysidine synthase
MKTEFLEFIGQNQLIKPGQTVLLAVSGGIDSMVMLDLFRRSGFNFAVAHCNFRLRGEESESDEEFVKTEVQSQDITLHIRQFDTKGYATEKGISIEMAARELRYAYFDELLETFGYDRIATAHHQDDVIETFFLNLVRKTGIRGLSGIKSQSGNLIRPMLFTNREAIARYALKNDIPFRNDSSNDQTEYRRNWIRHKILPLFGEVNPAYRPNILAGIGHLKEAEEVYLSTIGQQKARVVQPSEANQIIDIKLLLESAFARILLFEILSEYGFNPVVVDEVFGSLEVESGKQFFSATHRVIKDREKLIVTPITEKSEATYYIEEEDIELFAPLTLEMAKFARQGYVIPANPEVASLDFEKLSFPLVLKRWQPGEYFVPLGLKGFKKLSDFFVDEKFSLADKENTWILYSAGKVAWVIGHRIDDRFKITPETRMVYRIKCLF